MEIPELIERAKVGDSYALQRLVASHRDMALGYARKFVDRDSAEDAVQESMMIVHLKLNQLIDSKMFDSWLRGIIRNRCLSARAKYPRGGLGTSADHLSDGVELHERDFGRVEYTPLVEAVAQLCHLVVLRLRWSSLKCCSS
jgi:DNA-directed RNA polymerase specialized sigma24 family protein